MNAANGTPQNGFDDVFTLGDPPRIESDDDVNVLGDPPPMPDELWERAIDAAFAAGDLELEGEDVAAFAPEPEDEIDSFEKHEVDTGQDDSDSWEDRNVEELPDEWEGGSFDRLDD